MSVTTSQVTLHWPNKHVPLPVEPAVVSLCETFDPLHELVAGDHSAGNALFHGDNAAILAHLLASGWAGRFRLIYADPPYNSGLVWTRKVRPRGPRSGQQSAVAEQQPQYADAWDDSAYLQFLYERLPLLRQLLAEDGSLWLHCDHRHAHHVRCLLEEVFGPRNYLNTITWRSQTARGAKVNAFYFANSAHAIHIFAKDRSAPTCWTPARKTLVLTEQEAAAEFMRDEGGFFRTSDPGTFSFESLQRLHGEGRLYAPYGGEVVLDTETRRAYCSNGGNIGVKYYLTDLGDGRHALERSVDNIWDDIPGLGTTPHEDLGYPTQKTEALLNRVIQAATAAGDWVLDPFAGSGTTLAVAQKLGRRWIGCDVGYGAIQTARRRLQAVVQAQPDSAALANLADAVAAGSPAGFAVYCSAVPLPPGPLVARISITRIEDQPARIHVTVAGVTWAQATAWDGEHWRKAVDSIAIDPAYDGHTLRVALADAPLKKTQLVTGDYVLQLPPASMGGRQVAVRITDIWGQETLAVQAVPA